MSGARGPIAVGPGEGTRMETPIGGALTFKVRGAETGGAWTAFETLVEPGEGPPLHVHTNEDEVLYVLEGEIRFKLDDAIESTPAGSFIFIPRGARHTWQNVGAEQGRILVIFNPAGMERFWERFEELPPDGDPREAFRTIGSEVGMDVVGPPLAQSDPV